MLRQLTKIPKYAIVYFPEDDTVSRIATKDVVMVEGGEDLKEKSKVLVHVNRERYLAYILELSDDYSTVARAEEKWLKFSKEELYSELLLPDTSVNESEDEAFELTQRPPKKPKLASKTEEAKKRKKGDVEDKENQMPKKKKTKAKPTTKKEKNPKPKGKSKDKDLAVLITVGDAPEVNEVREHPAELMETDEPGGADSYNASDPLTFETESTADSISEAIIPFVNNNPALFRSQEPASSTLLDTPEKPQPNPFQSPLLPNPTPTTVHSIILSKLDEILVNQATILSRLNIRSQPNDDVSVAPGARPCPQSPVQLIATTNPMIQQSTATSKPSQNTAPIVNDSILAETLKLKPKSSSAGNLAAKLLNVVFKSDELVNRNCSGSRGKQKLDETKLKIIFNNVCKAYGINEEHAKITERECRTAIDEFLRRGNRARVNKVIAIR